jgi:hypothetical protein
MSYRDRKVNVMDKRIKAEEVVKAYEKTGMTPICERWYEPISKNGKVEYCGCALSAVMAQKVGRIDVDDIVFELTEGMVFGIGDDENAIAVQKTLGLHKSYVDGFVRGYDSTINFYTKDNATNKK